MEPVPDSELLAVVALVFSHVGARTPWERSLAPIAKRLGATSFGIRLRPSRPAEIDASVHADGSTVRATARLDDRTCCELHFARDDGSIGPAECALLERLLPYVRTAAQLQLRLDRLECSLAQTRAALDRLDSGIAVLDAQGGVLYANRAAASMARSSGLALSPGGMHTECDEETTALALAVTSAAARRDSDCETSRSIAIARANQRPLHVLVAPLKALTSVCLDSAPAAAVVAFITDPDRGVEPAHTWLSEHFELTPAEARLATLVGGGASLHAAAGALEISVGTARNHLKRVFAKTGCHRQAELVALLLKATPPL